MADIWRSLRPMLEQLGWTPASDVPGGLLSPDNAMAITDAVDDDDARRRLISSLLRSIKSNSEHRAAGHSSPNIDRVLADFSQAISCVRECESTLGLLSTGIAAFHAKSTFNLKSSQSFIIVGGIAYGEICPGQWVRIARVDQPAILRRVDGIDVLDNRPKREFGLIIRYRDFDDLKILEALQVGDEILDLFEEEPPN